MGNAPPTSSSPPPSAPAPAHNTVSTDPEPPSSLQPPPSQCGDCRQLFQALGKLPFTCPHCFACTRCTTCLETIARCPNCRKLWPDRSQPNRSLSRLLGLDGNGDDDHKEEEDKEEIAKVGMKMQRELAGSWHAGVIQDIKDVIMYTLDFDDGVTQEWTEEKMDSDLNIVAEPLSKNGNGTDGAMENFARLGTQIRPQRRAAAAASKQIKSIGMEKEPVQDVKHKRRGSNSTAQSTGSKKRPKSEFNSSNSFSKPSAAVKVKPGQKNIQASSDSDTETQTTEDDTPKTSKIDQGQRKKNSVKRFQVDWKARVAAIREKKKASQRSQDGE